MRRSDPLTSVAAALCAAQEYFGRQADNVDLWQQRFPNTSCGHGGVAGQAITEADVVVAHGTVGGRGRSLVLLAGRPAYSVATRCPKFLDDVRDGSLASKSRARDLYCGYEEAT